jgi:hypothetical protein
VRLIFGTLFMNTLSITIVSEIIKVRVIDYSKLRLLLVRKGGLNVMNVWAAFSSSIVVEMRRNSSHIKTFLGQGLNNRRDRCFIWFDSRPESARYLAVKVLQYFRFCSAEF